MTTFRNHSAQIMRHLMETKRPGILTVNGKAAAVVQDAEAYQHLRDLSAQASAGEGIRQGLEDLRQRRTRPARSAFDEIRVEHGIPRRVEGAGRPPAGRRYFTAPSVSPCVRKRCNVAITIATGSVASSVAAITWFHSTE